MKCDVCGEVWYDEDWYSSTSYCRKCGVEKPRSSKKMLLRVVWVAAAIVLVLLLVRAK